MPALVPRSGVRPDAHPTISPDALLVPMAPHEAYAADVDRLGGRAPLGGADDAWLLIAHALDRAASLGRADRADLCSAAARMVQAVLPADAGADPRFATAREGATAIAELGAQLDRQLQAVLPARDAHACPAATEACATATRAVLAMVADQERAGAFLLAFSTLDAVRRALAPVLDARARGLLLAQQGRVARQLGALATAARLYGAAVRAGRHADDPDVTARALLGAGALASNRGNYPASRRLYRRALQAATRANSAFLQRASHHGLLIAAFAAHDLNAALAHGWAAVRHLPEDATEQRAEMLINLGEVGRQAGEYRAALGACLSALELTDLPRVRLPALGTAARAAAALGESRLLDFLARDVDRTVARSAEPFEHARALVELGEAYDGHHNSRAIAYAARAQRLAAEGTFHEIAARADQIIAGDLPADRPGASSDRATRSPRARAVLRTLEALPAARRYEELAAC